LIKAGKSPYSGDESWNLANSISALTGKDGICPGNSTNSKGEAQSAFLQVPTGQQIWIMDRDGGLLRNIGPGSAIHITGWQANGISPR
jgi:hypothetical protein